MKQLCHCSSRLLDPQDATYVLGGIPACSAECYQRALDAANYKHQARAAAAGSPGTPWSYQDHRNMAKVMRDEGAFDVVS